MDAILLGLLGLLAIPILPFLATAGGMVMLVEYCYGCEVMASRGCVPEPLQSLSWVVGLMIIPGIVTFLGITYDF